MAASSSASTATSRPAAGHDAVAARASSPGPAPPDGEGAVPKRRANVIVQYLDVVLVVLAAPAAVALGAPVLGCAVGAGAWVLQRIIALLDRRWVSKAAEPRTQLGFSLFEAFGRIWLLAGAIVLAGVVGGRPDGLTAAIVIFAAYSVAFAVRVITGPPQRKPIQ